MKKRVDVIEYERKILRNQIDEQISKNNYQDLKQEVNIEYLPQVLNFLGLTTKI